MLEWGGKHSSWHWPWGKGKRGEVKNQALVVGVSGAEVGRIGRRGYFGKMGEGNSVGQS